MKKENLRFALILWISQFILALCCAFFHWRQLSLWDSMWYRHIVDNGYSSTVSPPPYSGMGNVGFFPGYPLLGWLFKNLFQVGTDAGLLIASSFSAVFAWTYFGEYLDFRGDAKKRSNLMWVWLYPFTFFFVAAYSDSLGAATLLGFILFTERWLKSDSRKGLWFALAALHGFGMTFTRVLSIFFIFYPLLRAIQLRLPINKIIQSAVLMGIAALGMGSFLIYCQQNFGAWNFYFITEKVIWGWSEMFPLDKLLPPSGLFNFQPLTRADTVGRYVTILFGIFFFKVLFDLVRNRRYREPIAVYFLLGGMFWGAYLLGRATWGFTGLGRYLIPLILIFIPDLNLPELRGIKVLPTKKKVAWGFFALVLLILQVVYAAKFARNGWVA